MTTEESKTLIRHFVTVAFERLDAAGLSDLLAPHFRTDAFAAFGVDSGPAGFQEAIRLLGASFANARVTVDDLIAEGDRVVMRYRWSADHTGPLMGIAATGRRVEMAGILIARLEGGKVEEYWRQEDMLGLMHQLGAA